MSLLVKESNEPVTQRRTLVEYFSNAEKPKDGWLIGCEHEKFAFRIPNLKPLTYEEVGGLRDFLHAMQEFGWKPVMEGDHIIGLSRGSAAISFEPGGQVELAGAPWRTLHETSAETDQHMEEVNAVGEKLDIGFLGMGFHPLARREDIHFVPKERYRIMRQYMPKVGQFGLDMMLRTCTVQVNLDYSDEKDMMRKMRVALSLQPIATSLFASSPFTEGKANGFNSFRMRVWFDTDLSRSGPIPFAFAEDFGYERYTDYALDVPMYFVWRDGRYIDCAGQSFRDFLAGKLPALPGEYPTLADWGNHLTTLFPDVRLKKVLEMRGADAGSVEMMKALPAFWVGILYDAASLEAAEALVKPWTPADRLKLHDQVPKLGFKALLGTQTVSQIAKAALSIAHGGLQRRKLVLHGYEDETQYLAPLDQIVEHGQNRSDTLLKRASSLPEFKIEELFRSERLGI